jgi:hypothetical protein
MRADQTDRRTAMEPSYYDVLVYRDFAERLDGSPPKVGESASRLGFGGLIVVAVGPGVHEGRSTIVLADEESEAFQRWLDRRGFEPETT